MVALFAFVPAGLAAPGGAVNINLKDALGAGNHYTDTAMGVSVTLPAGWTVGEAYRWGAGENTVNLKPRRSGASPSIYYTLYSAEEAGAADNDAAWALLKARAQQKEVARTEAFADYRNEPETYQFFLAHGRPGLAYLAVYTVRGQAMAEHFIRILGPKGYVMIFTKGSLAEVQALIPQLLLMASTVKGP